MAKGKNFNDFTYGVGLEVNATSFKQIKDELKVNLDNLSKMVKDYGKVLKIDPNADLSKLFSEMKKIKGIVDGINNSDNSFADFVDKGVLSRIATLESGLATVSATSKEVETNISGLKSSVTSMTEALKAAGAIKFPATFENLFGNIKDQSSEIKNITNQIKQLKTIQSQLKNMRFSIDDSIGLDFSKNKGVSEKHLDEYYDIVDKFYDLSEKLKSAKPNELSSLVHQYQSVINQMTTTFSNMSTDQFNDLFIEDYTKKIDDLINNIAKQKVRLEQELSSFQKQQAKYETKRASQTSSGKSLGIQSDYTAQVKVTPKANEAEWANKINSVIKNIESQLMPVKLTPTFSNSSKNLEKEVNGNLAQINHAINVDLKVVDNIDQFNQKIQNIDQSIKNARQQLEKEGNFKIRFEYEEAGKFKDAAYKIINQFKKIDAKFYISNGKKFILDVIRLKEKAQSELKNIPASIDVTNQDSIFTGVDNLRSEIDKKIGNIGVNLTIQNIPQFMSQAALMRDSLEQYYGDNPVGAIAGPMAADNNIGQTSKGMTELSDKAKQAQSTIESLKKTLRSLTDEGFKSKDFLNVGILDDNGSRIKGSTTKLKKMLAEYEELSSKLSGDKTMQGWLSAYPELNGDITAIANAMKKDEARLKQLEVALNLHLQKQIGFLQQQHDEATKVLETETKITAEKKKQTSAQNKDTSGTKINKDLAMSAEEATKKVRSLNGTLTQQKRTLKDLETNGLNASSFTRLGEWDKDTGSFKKNSKYIQELISKYNELRKARLAAGGKVATGEEASIRGKLAAILREQKKHMSDIVTQTQAELESVRQMSAAYKQVGSNKTKATKSDTDISSITKQVDELVVKLNKAKETLSLLKSGKLNALGSTGLGDINNRLGAAGSKQSFEDLIKLHDQLIAKKKQLESAGKTDSSKYTQFMEIYQGVEQQLSVIYKDQLKYTQSKIKLYETEVSKAKELLQIETQQTAEDKKQQTGQPTSSKKSQSNGDFSTTTVKLDGATLNSLAKDATLKGIDGKINSILTQLGNGVVINGSNISIEASNVSVSGKGTSTNTGPKGASKDPGEKEVKLSRISSYSQQLIALEERIKRTGLYTDDLQKKFVDLNAQLNAIQVQDDADSYKFDLDRFKEDFEQLKTYDKLYQDFIQSQAKQIQLHDQISTSNGPTTALQEQLKIEGEISKNIETQLTQYTTLYNQRARQLAIDEAIKKANQEITKNNAAQSDKDVNKQNNELIKLVDNAQKKFNEMQYTMSNFKVPMSDAAIAKLKEYEGLLTTLKAKQQEIAANPDLLKDESYKNSFNSLLQQMKTVQTEFTTLQKSSENFLSKIKSIEDLKSLGSTFDPTNLAQLHNEMQEFANQAGVGAAKLIEFNDVERTATFEIQNGKGQVQQLTVAYDQATNSLGRYTSKTKESLSESQKFFASLKHSFQNVARYIASFGSVYRIFAMIKQGVTYVKEIDSALTELKKVTDETDASYERFLQNMSKTASIVGSTVSELTTMSADWARLGYSMEEAGKLAESTAILLNVSEFDDATKASEALISTMQAFQYTADESQHVVDILNEVGNNYAVSSDGIATALQDSASALMEGGNNLEQATALVAAANKVVQDPNSVGSALRTISLRLRGTSVEILEEMGEETDGVAESTSKLQEKLKVLTGVDIVDMNGAYKDTYTILKEIGSVWKELDPMDQAAALELMAGKNRANTLAAILNNMEDLKGAYESALDAEGSALRENETYLDSIQGHIDVFTNEVQTFWMKTIQSDMVKGVVDLGTKLVGLVNKIGLIPPALAGVLFYFTAIKKNNPALMFKDMSFHAKNYVSIIQQVQKMKTLGFGNTTISDSGLLNKAAVDAYAGALSGLSAKQQAAILTSQGFTKAQAAQVLVQNNVDEAIISQTLGIQNLTAAKQASVSITGESIAATLAEQGVKLSEAAATWLADHATDELTRDKILEASAMLMAKGATEADIAALLGLAGAGTTATFSIKALGTALLTMMKTNPLGWIMLIISGVSMLISKAKQAREEVVKSAQEAIDTYKEAQSTLRKQKATIDGLSDSYERLSKGVNLDTNENISLTTNSYQEYLDICNDIADMYPHLVTGYDAQGNAILSLKGNVEALTQAYRDSAQAARQQMIAGGSDVFDTFKSTYSSDASTTFDDVGLEQKVKLAEEIQRLINEGTEDEINAFFDNLSAGNVELDGQKYSNVEMVKLFKDAGIKVGWNNMPEFRSSWDGSVDIEKFKQQSTKLLSFIKSATTQINTETSKVKSLMDAYLGEDFDYVALSDKSRAMINQIVSGFNAEFINGFDSADALYNWIKTNVVDAFKDPSVTDAISELSKLQFEFTEGEISYSDYTTQLNDHISKIKNKFNDEALAQIKIGIGIDEKSLKTNSNHIKTLLNNTVTDVENKISSLSIEDLQIAGQLEVPSDTLYSWEELTEKIKAAKIAATQDFDITNYTDAITAHSAAISEYQEALQSLDKGSFTMDDFMELIKKYPELAKGVDISSNAFHGLSRNLKGAISSSTKNFTKDLKELRVQLVAAGKSTDSIDQLIDAINNMPDDALGGIIKQYSTLTDKIDDARRAQDKLLASMDENPNEGYETRGEAMDYMKEAMKKGEIGSESNLWNVAEKYGFTYDSAKTINENADALAKYIAIREKWFQEEDDGDDRTNDGYSYKGTESFIKDVESAVKKSAELQQLLTWDYNETTGTLNFDYDNKDWDAIVSILSKTKELAGLTSDEFADMMIQIGQYFGIDWGNYNDVLDHLNEIASGSSDAKTKVEEYGQAMQEYFGEDTTIDLTVRPMVKFDSTNFAEWEKLYQGIVSNPEGHSEADVKNAKEQLEAIKRGTDVATVYTSTYTSDDGNKSIVVTPILPDGSVLSPQELEEYANKLLAGEEIDPDINIKLAEFDGANSVKMADEYAQALHEAQAQYDLLRDTLSINTTIDEKGIEGLKEIKEVQNSIKTNADGTVIINEDTFREALEGAQYTEDQIDLIIEKIKKLNSNAFIKFNVSDALETKGVAGLKEINELQGAIKEDSDTGLTILDTDMFTSVLEEAGYTKEQIQLLIDKIKEYQNIVAVAGNTDPLGLNNASLSIDSLKASLSTLDVSFSTGLGKWFDGKTDLNINVQDMVSALKAKGWTDEAIKEYMTQLANTNIDGFRIDVKTDQIDEALEKANEVPEEKETDYEVVGTGVKTLEDIDTYWDSVTKDKTTNYTIYETTVKKTKTEGSFWDRLFGSDDDDNTKYENKRGGSGTVFAGGTGSAPKTETALVGELGPELLVRNGRWTTVGENGAEFTQVKKGDIIFNHRQTEELLKNGYVTGRGKAYASGTAYADGGGTFGRYEFSGSGGYQEYNVNDTVVESWGDLSGMIEEAEDSTKDAKDAADEFAETFDWIEIRLEEINNQMDLLEAKVENAASASDKNALIDEMLALNETKLKNLKAGAEAYEAYADTLFNKIPAQYQEMARDGSISITQFAGEADEATVEAIENYREWEQKAADLNLQIEELKKNNAELAKQKFDNVADEYDSQIDLIDKQNDKIDAQISLMEDRGYVASEAYYNAMIAGTVSKGAKLLEERARLQKALDEGVRSGDITKGSKDYNELVAQIYDVDLAITECTADIEDFKNAIIDIKWDNFDELIDRIDYLSDETQNLIDLMENSGDVVDENGNWTDEGITSLGLYAQQMEIAEYRAKKYEEAIDELNKGYRMGLYSESEYQEKLNELKDAQYDSIDSYYEARDAIVDLNKTRVDAIKDGIEKEIDAYEELIDKKKEELDAEKELYDFQKSTMEQQKNITDIQRKLAALSTDNSASAVAQRKQLEAELAEAQTELDSTYYDRSIEQQQEALDRELEDFQNQKDAEIQMWEEYLTNVEAVVTDSLMTVQANTSTVHDTLSAKADEHGLHLSEAVITPWEQGTIAAADYQAQFDSSMSATMLQLQSLEAQWQRVIDKMNAAAAVEIATQKAQNAATTSATYKAPTTTTNTNNNKKPTQTSKAITVGGKINAGSAKIYSDSYGGGASRQYYSKDPVYVVLQEKNGYLLVRHHSKSSGYTGWFKKSDVKAYAKGTKKLEKSGIVNVDELGEELILGAKNGRLTYLEKDSGIIPADITSNLMGWGELNPQAILDRNRPSIAASPSVVNNTTEINLNIKEVVHVDTVTNDTMPDLTKAIDKQLDSYMVKLNNAIKAKVR